MSCRQTNQDSLRFEAGQVFGSSGWLSLNVDPAVIKALLPGDFSPEACAQSVGERYRQLSGFHRLRLSGGRPLCSGRPRGVRRPKAGAYAPLPQEATLPR